MYMHAFSKTPPCTTSTITFYRLDFYRFYNHYFENGYWNVFAEILDSIFYESRKL